VIVAQAGQKLILTEFGPHSREIGNTLIPGAAK
jgi:hypothetical protein